MKGFVTFQLILFSVLFLGTSDRDIGFHFQDVAKSAGIDQMTISGAQETNRYLLEGTGCGAAFFDYNNDGWLDVFLVNASRLEGFPKGSEPTNHLYQNNHNGSFTDVTQKAGLLQERKRWNSGCAFLDYDRDGDLDLFVANYIDQDLAGIRPTSQV